MTIRRKNPNISGRKRYDDMKYLIWNFIKLLLIPFGMLASVLAGKYTITILMYHRVKDEISKEMSLPQINFNWQMDYLESNNYNVISMDEALDIMTSGPIEGRYVVLTFDDGYEDFYSNAYPILKKHNFHSTVYIVPGFIETNKTFWWDRDIGESRLMNWQQIIELSESGLVTIGAHTQNHIDMNRLSAEDIEAELLQCNNAIARKIKQHIRHFSYPRGIYTDAAAQMIRKTYKTAVLMANGTGIRKMVKADQLIKLKRLPVQRSDGRLLFVARLRGWLFLEELLRKLKTMAVSWNI